MTAGAQPQTHVITPGDHFSPSTGSAVPTVVNGLCGAAPRDAPRSRVVVARGTYSDRYTSAQIVEYESDNRAIPAGRYVDVACGRLGLPRPTAGRAWRATLADQRNWPSSCVIGHNGPQLIRYVDADRHHPVLYAHNELFRTYGEREARATLARLWRLICVSDALAERTAASLPGSLRELIRVVPNGVDCADFRPVVDRPQNDRLTVLFVGRMIPDKGADVLLRAAVHVDRANVRYVVVGSHGFDPHARLTPFEESLRTLASATRSAVDFVATVPRPKVAGLLRSADVLVVPSRWAEPSGLTVTEGMATGIPVVASRIGGIPEQLGDAGILVPPDDPPALADALTALADDAALRARIGAAARARAIERDWGWSRRLLDEALAG